MLAMVHLMQWNVNKICLTWFSNLNYKLKIKATQVFLGCCFCSTVPELYLLAAQQPTEQDCLDLKDVLNNHLFSHFLKKKKKSRSFSITGPGEQNRPSEVYEELRNSCLWFRTWIRAFQRCGKALTTYDGAMTKICISSYTPVWELLVIITVKNKAEEQTRHWIDLIF